MRVKYTRAVGNGVGILLPKRDTPNGRPYAIRADTETGEITLTPLLRRADVAGARRFAKRVLAEHKELMDILAR